jgi:hypothetical protein
MDNIYINNKTVVIISFLSSLEGGAVRTPPYVFIGIHNNESTRNNKRTVGSGVFCGVRPEAI